MYFKTDNVIPQSARNTQQKIYYYTNLYGVQAVHVRQILQLMSMS